MNHQNNQQQGSDLVSCLAFIGGSPKGLNTQILFHAIQKKLTQDGRSTKCITVFTKKEGGQDANSISSTEDVQLLLSQIKGSIDHRYFNIPTSMQQELKCYRVDTTKRNSQGYEVAAEEISQDPNFLKQFVATASDEQIKQEQTEMFQEIERICQEILQNNLSAPPNLQQDKELDFKEYKIILYGPREEIEKIENTQIYFGRNNNYFYLKTINKNTRQIQEDKIYVKQAQQQYKKQVSFIKASQISLGTFDYSQIVDRNLINFYKIFSFVLQPSQNGFQNLLDINILLQNSEDDTEKVEKHASMSIELAYTHFYLKIEFPYLYIQKIRQQVHQNNMWYYFELVVPPKYYFRANNPSAQQNIDTKMNSWVRLDNFFALNEQNELMRMEFTNNTVIQICLSNNDNQNVGVKDVLGRHLKTYFSFVYDSEDRTIIGEKEYEWSSYLKESMDRVWQQLLMQYDFNLSYTILTLVSHNKISIFKLEKFLGKINEQIQLRKSQYIIEKTIEYLYNKTTATVNDRYRADKAFEELFPTVSQQENQLRIQESNNQRNIKIVASRRVSITPSGLIYNLKELEMSNRVMRLFSETSDQFIRGIFQDDSLENAKNMKYVSRYFRKMLQEFTILNKKYVNFGWSASQLRSCSSWFFNETESLTKSDVILRIGDFSGINPPAKKSARIGQCFSSSIPYRFKVKPQIKFIDDVNTPSAISEFDDASGVIKYYKKKSKCFTDGVGTISFDLAKQISDHLGAFFMSSIQVRYGGAKGVLCIDYNSDQKNTIQLRDSMLKYKITDEIDVETIDILERNKYRYGYLNRQVIILLRTLGIQEEYFLQAQREYVEELNKSALKDANIFTLFNNDYSKDGTRLQPITNLLRLMQTYKVNMDDDVFCQGVIRTLKKRGFYILRKKSNIYLKKSARLMGVIDEYDVLNEDEVFAYISQDGENTFFQIQGDVIVVKNPCLHPGDIRKLKAVSLETIQERLGEGVMNPFKKLRNILIFPRKGVEPITAQIAGSDLDGDCYFISWDERFIPESQKEPFNYDDDGPSKKAITQDEYNTIIKKDSIRKQLKFQSDNPVRENISDEQMLDFFIDFMNNENLGKIDNAHLVKADESPKLAEDDDCIFLANLHAKAVDYAKTGVSPNVPRKYAIKVYPDFMEKDGKPSYESQSILGKLYRDVKELYEKNCKSKNLENHEDGTQIAFIDKELLFNTTPFENEDQIGYIETKLNNLEDSVIQVESKSFLESEILFAIQANNQWNTEINNLKNFFGAQDEFEIYTGNFSKLIKVERQKKMSADIVQQRIISTLVTIKNRFELMFFRNLEEDKNRFYDQSNKRKYYSKKCKIRATIWYIICHIKSGHDISEKLKEYNDDRSLLNQIFRQLVNIQHSMQQGQSLRGNANRQFYNHGNEFIGLPWFIVGEILLEIKHENDIIKQKMKLEEYKQLNGKANEGQNISNQFDRLDSGNESDEYL